MPKLQKKPIPLKIFILGVMARFNRELTGYELSKIAKEWRFDHYIENASQASFYYYLKQLEKNGFISSKPVKDSNRPERMLYNLTQKGRNEIMSELYKIINYKQDFYFAIDTIMPFLLFMDKHRILKSIDGQIEHRKKFLRYIEKETIPRMKTHPYLDLDPFILLIAEHHKLHYECEIEFLKKFYEKVDNIDFLKNIDKISKKSQEMENKSSEDLKN